MLTGPRLNKYQGVLSNPSLSTAANTMYLPSLGPISTRKNPPLNPQLIKIDSLFLVRPEFGWSPRFKRPINQKKRNGAKKVTNI